MSASQEFPTVPVNKDICICVRYLWKNGGEGGKSECYWREELGNWVRWEGRSEVEERLISTVNFLGIVSNSFYYVNMLFLKEFLLCIMILF